MASRAERPADLGSIEAVTRAAFRDYRFSRQTEHLIVRALRAAGALTLSKAVHIRCGRFCG
jgi:putative acetyltransferase